MISELLICSVMKLKLDTELMRLHKFDVWLTVHRSSMWNKKLDVT